MDHTEGSRILKSRAALATMAAWAVIALTIALLATEVGEVAGMIVPNAINETTAMIYVVVGGGYTIAFIASVVLVAMWIHRAHANLHEAGMSGVEFTPGWAVGWYFIPFANLIKPFQAMRELWHASMGDSHAFSDPAPDRVKLWWGTWLVGNIVSNISTRMALAGDPGMMWTAALLGAISSVAIIACAWLLIGLIRDITNAHSSGIGAAQVFA